jgi:hypothetical protein
MDDSSDMLAAIADQIKEKCRAEDVWWLGSHMCQVVLETSLARDGNPQVERFIGLEIRGSILTVLVECHEISDRPTLIVDLSVPGSTDLVMRLAIQEAQKPLKIKNLVRRCRVNPQLPSKP